MARKITLLAALGLLASGALFVGQAKAVEFQCIGFTDTTFSVGTAEGTPTWTSIPTVRQQDKDVDDVARSTIAPICMPPSRLSLL